MKSFLRTILLTFLAAAASPYASSTEPGIAIERKIERLDELLQLSPAQRASAAEIFAQENAALQMHATIEERLVNGVPVRQQARARIRAMLTPAQQEIFDRAPQRLGGGAVHDVATKASRLDKVVALTDDQILQIAAIYQQEADALGALLPAERAGSKGAEIRQAAKTKARSILTPEQQQKHDANPLGMEDLEERAQVIRLLKTSPQIAARLGTVTRLSPVGSTVTETAVDERVQSLKGNYTYSVQGASKTETLKIFWERPSRSAPFRILKIETAKGEPLAF